MRNIFSTLFLAAAVFFTGSSAQAQLSWGVNGAGGSGTWDSSTANWYTGSSNVAWISGTSGTFAGLSGTVTISGTQTAGLVTFASTAANYVVTGGTLQGTAGGVTIRTNSNATIRSNLANFGALTKTGTSTLTLSGTNTFTSLAINTGAVVVDTSGFAINLNSLGQSGGTITLGVAATSSGTLAYTPAISGTNVVNLLSNITARGNGNDTMTVSGTLSKLTLQGTLSINNTVLTLAQTGSGGATGFRLVGDVVETSSANLKVAVDTSLFSSNNTIYAANVYNGANLIVGNTGALSSISMITLGNGTTSGTLSISTPVTVGGIFENGIGKGQIVSGGSTSSLTIANNTSDTYSGRIGGGGAADNLALTKSGTGTLTLSGTNNTYNGGTTVLSGTLTVANAGGSATGTGTVTVNSGAALTGSGSIGSSRIAINGYVEPGAGGSDTTGTLTLVTTGTTTFTNANLVFNLNTTTLGQSNQLSLSAGSGVLFTTSTLTLNLIGSNIIPDTTEFTLLTSSTTGSGVGGSIFGGDISYNSTTHVITGLMLLFNNEPISGYYANSYLKLVSNGTGYDIDVEVVPEPGTWALVLVGLLLLGVCELPRQYIKKEGEVRGVFSDGGDLTTGYSQTGSKKGTGIFMKSACALIRFERLQLFSKGSLRRCEESFNQ